MTRALLRPRVWIPALAVLLAAGAVGAWFRLRPPSPEEEVREIERAWLALRDAILQEDDEGFFLMHSRRARETALEGFPAIRAMYVAAKPEDRDAFHRLYRVTAEEFLEGEPRDLIVRMLPWKSGWRDRRDLFRVARVKDIRIEAAARPDGTQSRLGVLVLDISAALAPGEAAKVPPGFDPTVVFVRDEDGWRRRDF